MPIAVRYSLPPGSISLLNSPLLSRWQTLHEKLTKPSSKRFGIFIELPAVSHVRPRVFDPQPTFANLLVVPDV